MSSDSGFTATCSLCERVFQSRSNLYLHKRLVHFVEPTHEPDGPQPKHLQVCECPHDSCKETQFKTFSGYRRHLRDEHDVADITSCIQETFDTFKEAQNWKAEQEKNDDARFVMHSGVKRTSTTSSWRYMCHRKGVYQSKGGAERRLKSQGACRSTNACPAAMTIVGTNKKFYVTYHPTHYGHETKPKQAVDACVDEETQDVHFTDTSVSDSKHQSPPRQCTSMSQDLRQKLKEKVLQRAAIQKSFESLGQSDEADSQQCVESLNFKKREYVKKSAGHPSKTRLQETLESEQNINKHENLKKILPINKAYRYKLVSIAEERYVFTVNLNTRLEFEEWLSALELKTKAQFTIVHTGKVNGTRLDFYRVHNCHHNVRRGKLSIVSFRKRAGKHTACPSKLTAKILSCPGVNRRRIVDVNGRCKVTLLWNHNHPLVSADILRRHVVRPGTNEKLANLYRHGHNIATAMECLRLELEDSLKDGEKLENVLDDRSIYPDYQHCHYIFRRLFKRQCPTAVSDAALMEFSDQQNCGGTMPKSKRRKRAVVSRDERLAEVIASINVELGEVCVLHEVVDTKHVVAVCTPLMKRVHQHVQEAGELMFVYCFGDLDRKGYRVFLLMTHSTAGAVPLAVGITPSETSDALTRMFALMKAVLPTNSFFHRGRDAGPLLVLMQDSANEHRALLNVWPLCRQVLCQLQVLQALWQWLLLDTHCISEEDRPSLFELFKRLMYAPSEPDLFHEYQRFQHSPLMYKYNSFRYHVSDLFETKRTMWCSAYRHASLPGGNQTNSYTEASMRALKDKVCKRLRTFNITQIVHFMTDQFCDYYKRRLVDFAHGRSAPATPVPPAYEGQEICQLSDDVFVVASGAGDGLSYTVNTAVSVCTCAAGAGAEKQCEHVAYAQSVLSLHENSAARFDDHQKRLTMYVVAWGREPKPGWLEDGEATSRNDDEASEADVVARTEEQEMVQAEEELLASLQARVIAPARKNPAKFILLCRAATASLNKVESLEGASGVLAAVVKHVEEGIKTAKQQKQSSVASKIAARQKAHKGMLPVN